MSLTSDKAIHILIIVLSAWSAMKTFESIDFFISTLKIYSWSYSSNALGKDSKRSWRVIIEILATEDRRDSTSLIIWEIISWKVSTLCFSTLLALRMVYLRWNLQALLIMLQASNYLLQLSDLISVKHNFHSSSGFTKGSSSSVATYLLSYYYWFIWAELTDYLP